MPAIGIGLLNKTVSAVGQAAATAPPDALFVAINNIARGTYVKIHGISWGVTAALDADLTALDFGDLLIIRNGIYRPTAAYTLALAQARGEDIVFNDVITRDDFFRYRDFSEPIKLNDGSDYLIVMPAPVAVAAPATPYDCSLCVRGEICDDRGEITPPTETPKIGDLIQR